MENVIAVLTILILSSMTFYIGVLWGRVLESSERAEGAKNSYIEALEKAIKDKNVK